MSQTIQQRRKGSVKFVHPNRSLFFSTLKKEVDQYFTERKLSRFGNGKLFVKTLVLVGCYVLPFIALLIWSPGVLMSLGLWSLMGLGMAGVGMSVMHDANHGAYSENKIINWVMAHLLNLMGGSTINWKLQHNILHHTYTNITHLDDDIAAKPGLRLTPHIPRAIVHRYQWWHAFLLYGLTTLYWVTAKDFLQFSQYRRQQVSNATPSESRWILSKIIIVKTLYFLTFMVLPIAVFHLPWLSVLTGFLLMHFIAGLILTVVFQLAHSLEGTSHPLPGNDGIVANDWAIHQMNTTMNFSPSNRWLSWYLGGLNFQVEHHLFPRISHIHYPSLAPIVRRVSAKFDIPYLEHKHFSTALGAHIRFLKDLGRAPDWREAIG